MKISKIGFNNICAKQHVVAIIIGNNNKIYYGSNYCENPQLICPRESGEDYTKCKEICKQPAHAEINAINEAKKDMAHINATMILLKHRHMCDDCKQYARENEINEVIIIPN